MANPKPSQPAEWASGPDAVIVVPDSAIREAGNIPNVPPKAPFFNWWMKLVYQWTLFLDTIEDHLRALPLVWTGRQNFSAGVDIDNGATVDGGLEVLTSPATPPGAPAFRVAGGAAIAGPTTITGGLLTDSSQSTGAMTAGTGFVTAFNGTESTPSFFSQAVTAARALVAKYAITSGMAVRQFVLTPNKLVVTINARWNGTGWNADTPGTASVWMGLSPAGLEVKTYTAPDSNAFPDSSFTAGVSIAGSGTKGQVLGFTANNTASFASTIRGVEAPITNAMMGSNFNTASGASLYQAQYYRDSTGWGGMYGQIYNINGSVLASTLTYLVLTIPTTPVNCRPSQEITSGTLWYLYGAQRTALFALIGGDGEVEVNGFPNTSAVSATLYLDMRWRVKD